MRRDLDHEEATVPFPMSPVSNGEWFPGSPTPRQLLTAHLVAEETARRARRLGMSRRAFLETAAGTATAFMVLNRVHGLDAWGDNAALPVRKVHCDDLDAGRELLDRKMFVMDVQTHHLDLELSVADRICRALDFSSLAEGLGAKPSDIACPEKLGQVNFIKEVLINSQTQVLVISGVPNGVILGPDLMFRTRDLVNELAGSQRALTQAMIDPKREPGTPTSVDSLERQVNVLGAKALKCYTYNGNWRLDDETVAYPMLAEAQRLGIGLINVHKGLAQIFMQNPEYVRTTDFPKVVRDWPDLKFCAYHSGYFLFNEHPEGLGGITEFMQVVKAMPRKERKRVYAEIGSTFATVLLLYGPEAAAALMGELMKNLGADHILWGTDSMWWGSPQFAIDAFKNLEIPASMQEEFGYPALTEKRKRQILGLNAAKLYGLKKRDRRGLCTVPPDRLEQLQVAQGGFRANRSLRTYGPRTRREFLGLLERDERAKG
jgi:predicted TIM-barrel fold metal-dependent hydrolase